MKLIKLTIIGFGPFYEPNVINFAHDADKHITIIHGENGSGKTTVLNAVLWCLTGEVSPSMRNDLESSGKKLTTQSLAFKDIDGCMSAIDDRMEVSVEFQFKNSVYVAKREGGASGNLEGQFYLAVKNANILDPFTDPTSVMRRIFPYGVARYFMFDGEGFAKSATSGEGSFLSSVKNLLGFGFAEDSLQRLARIRKHLNAELNQIQAKEIKDKEQRERYKRACEEVAQLEELLERERFNYQTAENELINISEEIGQLKADEVKETNTDLERELKREKSLNDHLELLEIKRLELVRDFYRPAFGAELFVKGLDLIEKNRTARVIPAPYNERFIDDLIKDQECICGRDLGPEHIEKLKQLLMKASTDVLEDRLAKAQGAPGQDSRQIESFQVHLGDINEDKRKTEISLVSCRERIQELEEKLRRFGDREDKLEELLDQREVFRGLATKAKNIVDKAVGDLEIAKAAKLRAEPKGGTTISVEETKLARRIKKIDRLIVEGESHLAAQIDLAHRFMQETVSEQISKTTIQHRVRVDDEFRPRFITSDASSIKASEGQKKALEFAFLCSLVKLIQSWVDKKDNVLVPGTIAPLVIDAPFSEVDEDNQKIIAQILLDASEQLVVLLFNDHWLNLEPLVSGRLGKEYMLIQHLVGAPNGRSEKLMQFGGSSYASVHYDSEYAHSSLRELSHG